MARNKFTQQGSDVQGDDEDDGAVDRSQGATRAISSYIDPGLNWEELTSHMALWPIVFRTCLG